MKSVASTGFLFICLIGTANAKGEPPGAHGSSKQAERIDLPQCRGIVSQDILVAVDAAKTDPAVTFAKNHPGAKKPASVDCASKLWRATQAPSIATRTSKQIAPAIPKSTPQHALLSRSGRRGGVRAGQAGQGSGLVADLGVVLHGA